MNGTAGSEMMDDMTGDYSMFSKLALGLAKAQRRIHLPGERREYYTSFCAGEGGVCHNSDKCR